MAAPAAEVQGAPEVAAYLDTERRLFERYGIEPKSRYLELRDPPIRLRVLEVGSGPPVLFVHGAGCFAAYWAPLLAELRGVRAIVMDGPGRGLSDRFEYRGVDVREHGVTLIGSVLDALGLHRASLVGHSLGGYWSLCFAVDAPDRVRAAVVGGSPQYLDGAPCPLGFRLMGTPGLGRLLVRPSSGSGERRSWGYFAGKEAVSDLPDELFECSYREGKLPGSVEAIASVLGCVAGPRGWRPEAVLDEDDLGRVRSPVLFIWGADDVTGGSDRTDRIAAAVPDAALEVVPGGHIPWFDDPAGHARSIEAFLGPHPDESSRSR